MKEERIKILEMVEAGKISVEEAGKLLEALSASYGPAFCCEEDDFSDKIKEFCQNTENFLKSVGGKIGDFAKDMEPRIRNVTKVTISKTADIVDELGKALAACLNSLNKGAAESEECCCCGESAEENREN